MNNITKKELKKTKNEFKKLGIKYIDSNDRKTINHVIQSLRDIDTGAYVCFGNITYQEAIGASLEHLKVLGGEVVANVESLIKNISFNQTQDSQIEYSCVVDFEKDETGKIKKDTGVVGKYNLPKKLNILSPFHISHEHLHLLKETNYDEYIDSQIIGDVITILYEFIMADTYPEIKKELIRYRLSSLKKDSDTYEFARSHIDKEMTDKDLYKVEATTSGQYLNSFYYAVILFNMYKNEPEKILKLVNKVLNHEITTREMLKILGIFQQEKHSAYDIEFEEVKKYVKKV